MGGMDRDMQNWCVKLLQKTPRYIGYVFCLSCCGTFFFKVKESTRLSRTISKAIYILHTLVD
jgi:hypothetical protein